MSLNNLIKFCSEIGNDELLVQGAGGNVSIKYKGLMKIKASGQRLGDSLKKNIFSEVNLDSILKKIEVGNFNIDFKNINKKLLRPSIETTMHAIIPHKYVIHLHAIEILAVLVRKNAKKEVSSILGRNFHYEFFDYYKPGAELAKAIYLRKMNKNFINWYFLKSHGIVVSSDNLEKLIEDLNLVLKKFELHNKKKVNGTSNKNNLKQMKNFFIENYNKFEHSKLSNHFSNSDLFNIFKKTWKICPDHIVFLGKNPLFINSSDQETINKSNPPFIFCDESVYICNNANSNQIDQLICYYNLLSRQSNFNNIAQLTDLECDVLLDWDQEKYRQNLSKQI